MTPLETLVRLWVAGWAFRLDDQGGLRPAVRPDDCPRGSAGEASARAMVGRVKDELAPLVADALEPVELARLWWNELHATSVREWEEIVSEGPWTGTGERARALLTSYGDAADSVERGDLAALAAAVDGCRRVVNEAEERAMVPDFGKRGTQRVRILELLRARGASGATNDELNGIGFRYGARLMELRDEGWEIETIQRSQNAFTFVLRGVRPNTRAAREAA